MLADLERLIDLQQVDLRLQELTRQIDLFPQRRAEADEQLARARQVLADARARHTESLKSRKKLELDVQQLEEKIRKHKEQIYEVKSNEAYRALQHEIEQDEQAKAQAEDRELEAMIATEELEKQIQAAEAELAQVEQQVAATLRQLDQEQAVQEKERSERNAHREELRGQVDAETLVVYDRIARAHGGVALAEAREEICQVCRIHIRPQTFAEVRRSDQIHYCESCHRMLYYLPAPQAVAEASGEQPLGVAPLDVPRGKRDKPVAARPGD